MSNENDEAVQVNINAVFRAVPHFSRIWPESRLDYVVEGGGTRSNQERGWAGLFTGNCGSVNAVWITQERPTDA